MIHLTATEEECQRNPHLYTKVPHDLFEEKLSYGALGAIAVLLVDDGKTWSDIKEFSGEIPNATKGRSSRMQGYLREIEASKYSHLLSKIGSRQKSKNDSERARELMNHPGTKKCQWCERTCHRLIEHHYPIPYRFGGHEIVSICGTCHEDFHHFENQLDRQLDQAITKD